MSAAANTPHRMVFIGGCGRSGTTLLASALGAAPKVVVTPESQFKAELARAIRHGELTPAPDAIYARLDHDRRFRAVWKLPVAREVTASDASPEAVLAEVVLNVIDQYARRRGRDCWSTWVDHTPENFHDFLPLLRMFPNARFIHIVRDGRAVASSVMPLDWGPNEIVRAAKWWVAEVALGLAAESVLKDRVLRLSYEALTMDPAAELRRVCEFAGLPYSDDMLQAQGFDVPGYTSEQHSLVGKPFDPGRNDAWTTCLNRRELEMFEYSAGDLMEILGYPRTSKGPVQGPSLREWMALTFTDGLRRTHNAGAYRKRVDKALRENA